MKVYIKVYIYIYISTNKQTKHVLNQMEEDVSILSSPRVRGHLASKQTSPNHSTRGFLSTDFAIGSTPGPPVERYPVESSSGILALTGTEVRIRVPTFFCNLFQ